MITLKHIRAHLLLSGLPLLFQPFYPARLAAAQLAPPQIPDARQSLDDAWWTGPLLAPNASTLPRGHILIEPYLFDVIATGRFDSDGGLRTTAHSNGFGSLTYINYGLADRLTIGMLPVAGLNLVSHGTNSSGVGLGDLTVQAQYRLTLFHEGSWLPTTSINVQETFPTGKYDRLGNRPSDGFGSGAYTTTIAFYSQTYFWLPNRRILRTRLNLLEALSSSPSVHDVSVYGTQTGFRGRAYPGSSTLLNAAFEYSVTRNWVLASDITYRHALNTHVAGYNVLDPTSMQIPPSIRLNSGSSDAFGLAPAIEYNWTSRVGVIAGVRVFPAGRNTSASVTPAVAINIVH
jgi:hypothetical protein